MIPESRQNFARISPESRQNPARIPPEIRQNPARIPPEWYQNPARLPPESRQSLAQIGSLRARRLLQQIILKMFIIIVVKIRRATLVFRQIPWLRQTTAFLK